MLYHHMIGWYWRESPTLISRLLSRIASPKFKLPQLSAGRLALQRIQVQHSRFTDILAGNHGGITEPSVFVLVSKG